MAIPNLIHPVECVIRRKNSAATKQDPLAREPVRTLYRAGDAPNTGVEVTLQAQVNWNDGKYQKPMRANGGGPELDSDGYILVRLVDLLTAGVATDNGDGTVDFGIVRGDRIVRIGRRKTNLFVSFFRDVAFYPDQQGGTLLEINFEDREPSEPS